MATLELRGAQSYLESMRFHPLSAVTAALLVVAGVSAATTAHAQRLLPSTTGFSVAVSGSLARTSAESQGITSTAQRFAPRVDLSYGVTPRVSLVGALSNRGALIEGEDYTVRSVDLGARYLGFVGRELRPFLEGGLAVRTFSIAAPVGMVTATDVGPWAAAGYLWFPAGRLALEAAGTYGRVSFNNWRAAGNGLTLAPVGHKEIGVRAGVRWFFRPR